MSGMGTAKQDVELLLNKLPADCSLEDIQYHLSVLEKVRHGLEDLSRNGNPAATGANDRHRTKRQPPEAAIECAAHGVSRG